MLEVPSIWRHHHLLARILVVFFVHVCWEASTKTSLLPTIQGLDDEIPIPSLAEFVPVLPGVSPL